MPFFGGKNAISADEAKEYVSLSNRLLKCTGGNRDLAMSLGALFDEKRVRQLPRDEYVRQRQTLLETLPELEEQQRMFDNPRYQRQVAEQILEIQTMGKAVFDDLLLALSEEHVNAMREQISTENLIRMTEAQRLQVHAKIKEGYQQLRDRQARREEVLRKYRGL